MSLEKIVANRQWFANNVKAGDSVSFVYNGLQRFGEVVESVRLPNPAAGHPREHVRGWLTLEMTVPLQDREDVNGKVPSKFKRFCWSSMSRGEKYWTLNCGWKSQGENNMSKRNYYRLNQDPWNDEIYKPKKEDKPEEGKQYLLVGGADKPSIANGNSWAESEVKS